MLPETYAVPWSAFMRITWWGAIGWSHHPHSERISVMTGWVILVDQPKDFPNAETPHKVITTSEYLARPRLFDTARPKLVNLSRSYAYQSKGYYASLLAEARGHRVMPTVETMLELREAKLYEHALPELEDELNRCARRADFQPEGEFKLLVCFGIARDARFESFGRLLFDWFRCPALEVTVEPGARGCRSTASGRATSPASPTARRRSSASRCTSTPGANGAIPRRARVAKYDLAVLYDPNEKLPPSSPALDQVFRAHRGEALGRCRADHASASSPSSPNTTGCSSARPPRSTTTPTASRGAPGRRACRSSTIRSR